MAKIVLPQKGLTQHNNLSKLTTFDSVFQLLHSALENNWDISFSINNVRTSDELLLHSLERLHSKQALLRSLWKFAPRWWHLCLYHRQVSTANCSDQISLKVRFHWIKLKISKPVYGVLASIVILPACFIKIVLRLLNKLGKSPLFWRLPLIKVLVFSCVNGKREDLFIPGISLSKDGLLGLSVWKCDDSHQLLLTEQPNHWPQLTARLCFVKWFDQ